MFENAFAFLGLQYAKFQFRSDIDQVQSMTGFLSGARNVLVILPAGYEEAVMAGNALRDFRERLHHRHLTIVNNSTWATPLANFPRCEVVRINPTDINRFSLPTRALLQRILHVQYDVALDLNLDFVLHTAYICKASRAQVRVGFSHPASDIFFNVQINLHKRKSPQVLYDKFAECLSMF